MPEFFPVPFSVEVLEPEPGTVEVRLDGELDIATVGLLTETLDGVNREEIELLRIDLTHLTFIDSTGLAAIFREEARLRAQGRRLTLRPGPEQVQRAFEVAGMLESLSFKS